MTKCAERQDSSCAGMRERCVCLCVTARVKLAVTGQVDCARGQSHRMLLLQLHQRKAPEDSIRKMWAARAKEGRCGHRTIPLSAFKTGRSSIVGLKLSSEADYTRPLSHTPEADRPKIYGPIFPFATHGRHACFLELLDSLTSSQFNCESVNITIWSSPENRADDASPTFRRSDVPTFRLCLTTLQQLAYEL